jgi:hypothetical protein
MAAVEKSKTIERRRECRCQGGGTRWRSLAILRPGQPITLLNISTQAALVESASRLRPGARTEMQLAGPDRRVSIAGRLGRCYVAALDPLRYRAVMLFDKRLDLSEDC